MSGETVLCEVKDHIATITLNRPDRLNALNVQLCYELERIVEAVSKDQSIRCVILTGAGRGFCAGADIRADKILENQQRYPHPDKGGGIHLRLNRIIPMMLEMPKPVIGSINGVATGGGANLALASDIVIASDKAQFSQIFSRIGLMPDCGGCYFLPRLVGVKKAMELYFTNEMVKAEDAVAMGMINKVVEHDKLQETTWNFAQRLASGPTMSYAATKAVVYKGLNQDLRSTLNMELAYQLEMNLSEDFAEGVRAFAEKRTAKFQGR